ncbi:MAG: hypothetical protein IJ433_06610, partial [Ruminococcus sp.]|nr:hypothetical protein [Ruminococcus sp.]
YFTTVFSPTDVYKQKVTAEVSGMSGVEMQIVTQDSANQEITINNGNSAVVPSGNTLVIKMKIPESAGAVSLSCIRDHDAFGDSASDPSIEIFDEDLLDYITVENGYYVFTCPMPYSQCTFKLHVDAADENGNFIIENYEDLCNMVNLVNSGNKKYTKGNFILTNDIDCPQESVWTTSIGQTDLYYNADPESNGNWGFGGTFDGNGHVIRNLIVRGSTKVDASFGLFGTVSGTVKNLGIENFTYKGATKDSRVGAIAGQILNGGKIENCYVINGNINTKVLTTSGVAGGIAGANYSGSIENCYVYNSTISAARAGGIVGDNYGDGNNADGTDRPGTIKNCYTTSDRICERGTATDSKASVSAEIYASGEIAYLLNSGTVNGTQAWYQNLDNGLTPEAYPVLVSNGNNTVYKVDSPDRKYSNFNSDKLDKDENGNFIIKTYDDLCLMAVRVNSGSNEYVNGSYVLANNIIIPENEHWTSTIGNNEIPFCGTFDGQGYSISGLTITKASSNTVGLFGALKGATVKNTHLKDVNIDFETHSFSPAFDGPDTVTGALCGKAYLSSVISNCTTSGNIKAKGALQVSGMCGYLTYSNIDNCINYCDIESNSKYVGGLIGAINQEVNINNCANLGDITCDGTVYCGGIISSGITSTSVNNCYNTGKINGTFTDLGNKYYIGPIRGDKNPETNCYVLDNNTKYSTLSKICTLEEFTCGEVTFLLNKGVTDGTQAWYQNLDNDELPNLLPTLTNNGKNTVYTIPSQKGYSNYQHNDKASVLERVDLRTYQRVINPDGTFSEDSKFYYGFGLVNNDSKEITLFVLDTAQRIGILRHQGRDENHTAGEMVLLGDYPKLNVTSKELLASGQEEPDIYTDKNHCIFIKIPEDGEIPPIKVKYTEKPTSDFTPTEYTLKIKVVDSSYLKTVGASRTSVLSEDDLNYAVYESEQAYANALKASPQQPTNSTKDPSKNVTTNNTTIKTGSTINCALALLIFFAALAFILIYKRKHKAF